MKINVYAIESYVLPCNTHDALIVSDIYTIESLISTHPNTWEFSKVMILNAHVLSDSLEKLLYMLRYWIITSPSNSITLHSTCMNWERVYYFFGRNIHTQGIASQGKEKYVNYLDEFDVPYEVSLWHRYRIVYDIFKQALSQKRGTSKTLLGLIHLSSMKQCREVATQIRSSSHELGIDKVLVRSNVRNFYPDEGKCFVICTTHLPQNTCIDILIDTGMIYMYTDKDTITLQTYSQGLATQRLKYLKDDGLAVRTFYKDEYSALPPYIPVYIDIEQFILNLHRIMVPSEMVLFDHDIPSFIIDLKNDGFYAKQGLTCLGQLASNIRVSTKVSRLIYDNVIHTCDTDSQRALMRTFAYTVLDGLGKYGSVVKANGKSKIKTRLQVVFGGVDEFHTYINIFLTLMYCGMSYSMMNLYSIDPHITREILLNIQVVLSSHVLKMHLPRVWIASNTLHYTPYDTLRLTDKAYQNVIDTLNINLNLKWLDTVSLYDTRNDVIYYLDKDMICDTVNNEFRLIPLCSRTINLQSIIYVWAKGTKLSLSQDVSNELYKEVKEREFWKTKIMTMKQSLLNEIENDVAYRPGNIGFLDSQNSFQSMSSMWTCGTTACRSI